MPGVLVGKLALDRHFRNQGLGIELLADAVVTAYEAVMLIGGVYLVVEPMVDRPALRAWYEGFGFKSFDGTQRMFLSFNEFSKGSPI